MIRSTFGGYKLLLCKWFDRYTQQTNSEGILCQNYFPSIVAICFRLHVTLKRDTNVCPFVRDGDKNICCNLTKTTSHENAGFRSVIRTAPKDTLRTTAVRDPARRDGRWFAFPVRGISFRVFGSFPKQTETGRLNGHRIATATSNYCKRERNANSTGTSTSCASYRGSF